MHEQHGHRAFAYRGGDALDRLVAHVACGEDAGDARLERERLPVLQRPGRATLGHVQHLVAREDEPALRARRSVAEPVGVRLGADEDEHRRGGNARELPGLVDRDLLQLVLSVRLAHLRPQPHGDLVGHGLDAVDEVLRHRLLEALAAIEDRHVRRASEVERGLPGGVGAADDERFLAVEEGGVARGRSAVPDSASGETVGADGIQPPVRDPGGEQYRVGGDGRPVGELHDARTSHHIDGDRFLRGQELGAEAAGLRRRSPREVGSGEPGREPKVVLDARAHPGLPAERLSLDDDRSQPFRSAVDGGRESGGAGTDDDEVVVRELLVRLEADPLRDLGRIRVDEGLGVRDEHDRKPVRGERCLRKHLPGTGVLHVEPAVRDLVVRQQVAHALRVGRQPVADHAHGIAVRIREVRGVRCGGMPVFEQVVEHRVQPLLGGMPGLHEVVVEPDVVDGAHRDLGVGVCREEDPLRVRRLGSDVGEQLDARHLGHALIRHDERRAGPLAAQGAG